LTKQECQKIPKSVGAKLSSKTHLYYKNFHSYQNIKVKHAAAIEAINTFVYYKENTYLYPLHLKSFKGGKFYLCMD